MSKSSVPVLWPMWMIFFLIVNNLILLFVIKLSFTTFTWENALLVTGMDRIIGILAILWFCLDTYFLIGMIRIVKRKWSELSF